MKETDLVRKIRRALEDGGVFVVKIHGGQFQAAGLPDLVCVREGKMYALEVKLPGKEKTLTPRQTMILEKLRNAGAVAEMVTSVDQALGAVFGHEWHEFASAGVVNHVWRCSRCGELSGAQNLGTPSAFSWGVCRP